MLDWMRAKIKELFGSEAFLVTVLVAWALSCESRNIAYDVKLSIKTPPWSVSKIHLDLPRSRAFEDADGSFARTASDLIEGEISISFAESVGGRRLRNYGEGS
jgi:hypothetical protein